MKCIDCDCCHETVQCQWNALTAQYENVSKYYCCGVPEPFEIKDINKECTEYPEKRGGDMPIIEKDNDVCIKYNIPQDIKMAIPEEFYYVLYGFLIGTFGYPKVGDIYEYLIYLGGTGGWNESFRKTCEILNISWLQQYYDNLLWYDSDVFDGEIIDEIRKRLP